MNLKDLDMKRFIVISAVALLVGFAAGNAITAFAGPDADAGVVWIKA